MITLPNIKGLVALGKAGLMAHRSELLFGASITSTIGAVVLAAKGGWDARGIVDEVNEERALSTEAPLTPRQVANLTWHCYVPAALGTVTSVGSTTGLHIVHIKEKKQLAAMALMAIEEIKSEAHEYAEKIQAIVEDEDKKPAEKVKELNAVREGVPEWMVDEKLYLVSDEFTGRTFYASETRLQSAVNEVNKKINKDGECDLNTFYMWAGVEEIDRGVEMGWSGEHLQLLVEDDHLRSNGEPVRKFIFRPQPTKGFDAPSA